MTSIKLSNSKLPNPIPYYLKTISTKKSFKAGDTLPKIECSMNDFKFNPASLKKYCDLCNIEFSETIPLLYPHSFVGPLHLQLMTHKLFPFGLMGAVHQRNHTLQHKPLKLAESYDVKLSLGDMRYIKSGIEFDLITTFSKEEQCIQESVSTYLVRKKTEEKPEESQLSLRIKKIQSEKRKYSTIRLDL